MSRQTVSSNAFVLRKTAYKDSDFIVTLFTEELGKVSAITCGARKNSKRFIGSVDPFSLLNVVLELPPPERQLRNMKESTLQKAYLGLAQNMPRLSAASFVVELFRESIPDESPDIRLFKLLRNTLDALEGMDASYDSCSLSTEIPKAFIEKGSKGDIKEEIRQIVVLFELRLLTLTGYSMEIARCNSCGLNVPCGKAAYFHPGRGGIVCSACGGGPILLSSSALQTMDIISKSAFDNFNNIKISLKTVAEIETATASFIEYHLGKTLMTRFLYEKTIQTSI